MRSLRTVLVALVVLAGLIATPAAAQERQGFFFGVGLGYGSLDITCDGCDVDREGGFSGMLRLGGALSPRLLLGVESEGWYKDEDGGSVTAGTLTASAYYYVTQQLYLRGGVGLASLGVEVDGLGSDSETGFGWSVGAGYDIRISPNKAITPYFNWMWGTLDDGGFNIYQVGAALSIY